MNPQNGCIGTRSIWRGMNTRLARAILAIVVFVGVLAVVGVVAYNLGVNSGGGGHAILGFGPMRGSIDYHMFGGGTGVGLWGLILMVLIVIGIVGLLAAVFGGWGRDHSHPAQPTMPGQTPAAGEGLDKLGELSAMHDKGALTDEEFTAAKRKLLGL